MGWVVDSNLESTLRKKFNRPAWGKGKSSCACTCVCGHSYCTCSLWLGVVGKIEKFCYWFAEVNAPTELAETLNLVDVADEDDDDLVSPPALQLRLEGEAAVAEQKKIDDDPVIREKTIEGTVTLM